MRILKVLYLFLFLSSFSTTQKHVIYVYIEDYNRVFEFTNSKSEFLQEKRQVVFSIESPKLISCQVFLDNVLIEQGNFEVTDDKYELNIMVPIGVYDDALKDSTIFYPIYKKIRQLDLAKKWNKSLLLSRHKTIKKSESGSPRQS